MKIYLSIFLVFIINCYAKENLKTLQQLHVVFRHGDRNPEISTIYPNDPNINDTWAPEGFGQLTLHGKMQEYNLGKALRQRYGRFLGRLYVPGMLEALSTHLDRTKMSLQLVLAGLFPPSPLQKWNAILNWQPIPYNYVAINDSNSPLTVPIISCQKYIHLYTQTENIEYYQDFLKIHADLVEYISENSGLNITKMQELFRIHNSLFAETQTGRKIPEWTKKVFPDFLYQATSLYYEIQTYNDELNKFGGGKFLKKVIADLRAKKDGSITPEGRKIFLYSGHEYNVVQTLAALGIFKSHVPPYASYVVIEFHKIDNIYGVKILYQNYSGSGLQYMTIPNCETFCPFEKFVDLTASVIPDENTQC